MDKEQYMRKMKIFFDCTLIKWERLNIMQKINAVIMISGAMSLVCLIVLALNGDLNDPDAEYYDAVSEVLQGVNRELMSPKRDTIPSPFCDPIAKIYGLCK